MEGHINLDNFLLGTWATAAVPVSLADTAGRWLGAELPERGSRSNGSVAAGRRGSTLPHVFRNCPPACYLCGRGASKGI